ncbi:MAG: PDDEXK nuclease domain-containing protein [Marinifilaceae bacterium]|jgi:predicted nuclease of restriction endonuclease-like (RecB) superfamily|nr:PDDEXK nuclease domain-containing protein [Marinifilaceae bacterium]
MTKLIPNDYISVFNKLKERIKEARYKAFSSVNSEMIKAYLDIGKEISIKTKTSWGTSVVKQLSTDLRAEFPGTKGFSERNLRSMKFVYEKIDKNLKWQQAVAKLHWGHTVLIFSKIKHNKEIEFYLLKTKEENWSRTTLEEKIRFNEYQKYLDSENNFKQVISNKQLKKYANNFKDEYNLSFLNLSDNHTEKQLEDAIVKNITRMLGQLGSDFAFMGQQFRIEFDDKEYFVDLLFYHRKLKAMVAIELKVNEFKPEYSQQLSWYLHLLDKEVKYPDDRPSIGILLCKSKSKLTVEYALELSNNPIGVASYTYSELPEELKQSLPGEEEFNRIIEGEE